MTSIPLLAPKSKPPLACAYCGSDLSNKPYARTTHDVTGRTLNLCLKGCRWFPEAYPVDSWSTSAWHEEIVNAKRPFQLTFSLDTLNRRNEGCPDSTR